MKIIISIIKRKEIFIRLLTLTILCTSIVCLITIVVLIKKSEATFKASYIESNDIIVSKIQSDYDRVYQSINQSFDYIDKNNYVKSYLTAPKNDVNSFFYLKKELEYTRDFSEDIPLNLVLIGNNGRSFYQDDKKSIYSVDELLNGELIRSIRNTNSETQSYFRRTGLTTAEKSSPGVLFSHKIKKEGIDCGFAFIFIPEESFASIYKNSLDPSLHSTLIVDNKESVIISSNNKKEIGKKFESSRIEKNDLIKLTSLNFVLYDSINQTTLVKNMNLQTTGFLLFFISIILTSVFSFYLFKKITSPIYSLMSNLTNVTNSKLTNKIELSGTYETRQLGQAYNEMLVSLEVYIRNLVEAEKKNHLMEIRSLQMQIQPHFIYNTLTAIKFLSLKGEQDTVVLAIDSFIHLLQETFNNREFVTLENELHITKDYIELLQIRYGSQIETFFFTDPKCKNIAVPKLIIQPIIENSFLHAFPDEKKGSIQIFSRQKENQLQIEIIDNGVGFSSQHSTTNSNTNIKNKHYSSVGLSNVHDRIKLIYGEKYGIIVTSEKGKGTVVILNMPLDCPDRTSLNQGI